MYQKSKSKNFPHFEGEMARPQALVFLVPVGIVDDLPIHLLRFICYS
jgi:hypothetical protein